VKSVATKNKLGIESFFQFTSEAISISPDKPGVFAFFDTSGEAILIGSAMKSVREQLADHWKGYEGSATCGAAYLGFEAHPIPLERGSGANQTSSIPVWKSTEAQYGLAVFHFTKRSRPGNCGG
jgi:hypothetical protein